jgi:hypothetical protein
MTPDAAGIVALSANRAVKGSTSSQSADDGRCHAEARITRSV